MATAQNVIDRVNFVIQDTTNVRWTTAEMFQWTTEAQNEIVKRRPGANVINGNISLVAGTKQSLPVTGLVLLDVVRNMGSAGSTAGNAIRMVDRRILDEQTPSWHSSASNAVIKHAMFDARNPNTFYVYPPAATPTFIECVYSASVTAVAAVGDNLTLNDIYLAPVVDWVLYRCYSKDTEYAGNVEKAAAYRASFESNVNVSTETDKATSANVKLRGNGVA